uniref:NACHT domain-containing protein n=1 Tax=Takifugu rubripes TaxID=31033 RepID=A0A674NJ75_TAKRU
MTEEEDKRGRSDVPGSDLPVSDEGAAVMDAHSSGLTTVRTLRLSLVDELEGRIDALLDLLVEQQLLNRDDREEVLGVPGPRARVRRLLDIVECKGEEAAKVLLDRREEAATARRQSAGCDGAKQKHREVLRRRSENMLLYNTRHGEKLLFSQHYVNLLLMDGHQGLEMKKHEVLVFGQKRLSVQLNRKISPSELFRSRNPDHPVRKVLVSGVAGIGKTVLVQKMLFDFGRSSDGLGFDFIVHMTFRELNLIHGPTSLREMILQKNRHLSPDLDAIFANEEQLLIILDGFDEFRHCRSCEADAFVTEPDQEAPVVQILASLMQAELLPGASVMLTSRPAAIGHVPVGCIDRFVLIAGFSLMEVQEFFSRFFRDAAVAQRMFAAVSANQLMLTLCYIPAFCSIVCCILREGGGLAGAGTGPRTMTDIYLQYLVALLRSHTQARVQAAAGDLAPTRPLTESVLRLGRLAFQKLMEHQTLFYSSDPDVADLDTCELASSFLDKTVARDAGYTEELYSFAHLTVQEFFAALYCAVTEGPFPDALERTTGPEEGVRHGHLDLFNCFLSGIFSERNSSLLFRQVGLRCHQGKAQMFRQRLVAEVRTLCEEGGPILNQLRCLLEQQDPSLVSAVQPRCLRVNVSDETLSQMDLDALQYFLSSTGGRISELDLTGTGVTHRALRLMQPLLFRCQNLWLGENDLGMDSVRVIADVLRSSDAIDNLGIGWSNIGDEELLVLADAIRSNRKLRELWMEGNRISRRALLSLADLTPSPLLRVVAIWNDLPDAELLGTGIMVDFTEDRVWEDWGKWVFNRCEMSSNERLLLILRNVCKVSGQPLDGHWAHTCRKLLQLIEHRMESCSDPDVYKKLKKFKDILGP